MSESTVLPIRKAAEEIGIPDIETLRRAAKKFGALILVAGLEYVDRERYDAGVQTVLLTKIEQAARRARTKSTGGRSMGLVKARTERAPGLIMAKESTIVAAKKQVEDAPTPYEKSRAKKTLAQLEASLKSQKENFAKDKAELDRLLNEEPE
ncbi:hypothetical protein HZB60_12305 [candidate division KSB1 bacterium]|nr:hypothetical protein [candidate division KSB1 bacterium]